MSESKLKRPLTIPEVMAVSGRGEVRVRNAANSGALKSLPRAPRTRFFFTEDAVAEWIAAGTPEMPAPKRRGRAA